MKPLNASYEKLFKHFKFVHGMEMKNRLVMGPLFTQSSHENGELSDKDMAFYRERIKDVSMVIVGPAYIEEGGKTMDGQLGIHRDYVARKLHKFTAMAKRMKVKTILRISHGGALSAEYLKVGDKAVAPSRVTVRRKGKKPKELNEPQIDHTLHAFARATERAIQAGFDGVEIEGGSGHLLQQFASKQANHRKDTFGGTAENRLSFSIQVIRTVSKVIKNTTNRPFLLGYAMTPEEKGYGGNKVDDTMVWIDQLIEEKVDYVHLEVKSFHAKTTPHKEGEAEVVPAIIKRVNQRIPIISGGNLFTPLQVEEAIRGKLSMVTIQQALNLDPYWVEKVRRSEEPFYGKVPELEEVEAYQKVDSNEVEDLLEEL